VVGPIYAATWGEGEAIATADDGLATGETAIDGLAPVDGDGAAGALVVGAAVGFPPAVPDGLQAASKSKAEAMKASSLVGRQASGLVAEHR
jgi:hypothetical protein